MKLKLDSSSIYIQCVCVCVCGGGGGGGAEGCLFSLQWITIFHRKNLAKTDFLSTDIRADSSKTRICNLWYSMHL